MHTSFLCWIMADCALHLAGAAGFLLLGWRLGRESAGRPMFAYSCLPARAGDDAAAAEEDDPWTAASIAAAPRDRRPATVDIFETLAPNRPQNFGPGTP